MFFYKRDVINRTYASTFEEVVYQTQNKPFTISNFVKSVSVSLKVNEDDLEVAKYFSNEFK